MCLRAGGTRQAGALAALLVPMGKRGDRGRGAREARVTMRSRVLCMAGGKGRTLASSHACKQVAVWCSTETRATVARVGIGASAVVLSPEHRLPQEALPSKKAPTTYCDMPPLG
eukprot:scaffold188360_cov37-Tisochrysis_lutea.AAC.1